MYKREVMPHEDSLAALVHLCSLFLLSIPSGVLPHVTSLWQVQYKIFSSLIPTRIVNPRFKPLIMMGNVFVKGVYGWLYPARFAKEVI